MGCLPDILAEAEARGPLSAARVNLAMAEASHNGLVMAAACAPSCLNAASKVYASQRQITELRRYLDGLRDSTLATAREAATRATDRLPVAVSAEVA